MISLTSFSTTWKFTGKAHIFDFRPGTDLISLLILLLFLLLGWLSSIKPKAPSFQIGLGLNLVGLFFEEYTSIDGVRLSIWCHNFKMVAISFHAEKCCPLVGLTKCLLGTIVHSYLFHLIMYLPYPLQRNLDCVLISHLSNSVIGRYFWFTHTCLVFNGPIFFLGLFLIF